MWLIVGTRHSRGWSVRFRIPGELVLGIRAYLALRKLERDAYFAIEL